MYKIWNLFTIYARVMNLTYNLHNFRPLSTQGCIHNTYHNFYIIVHNVHQVLLYVCIMYCLCKSHIESTLGNHCRSCANIMRIMYIMYILCMRYVSIMDADLELCQFIAHPVYYVFHNDSIMHIMDIKYA